MESLLLSQKTIFRSLSTSVNSLRVYTLNRLISQFYSHTTDSSCRWKQQIALQIELHEENDYLEMLPSISVFQKSKTLSTFKLTHISTITKT